MQMTASTYSDAVRTGNDWFEAMSQMRNWLPGADLEAINSIT